MEKKTCALRMPVCELWLVDVRRLEGREAECMARLTSQRRQRAERFRHAHDRLSCGAAGLLLRKVLGVETDAALRWNAHGKPELTDGKVRFSLSHGGSYAVLACFPGEVGVDVEPIARRRTFVPRRFLREDEAAWLGETPTEERFAFLWTRLESALKADGRGFAMKDRPFSVLEGGGPWHLHTLVHDGHMISCAAGEPFEPRVNELTAEELLT